MFSHNLTLRVIIMLLLNLPHLQPNLAIIYFLSSSLSLNILQRRCLSEVSNLIKSSTLLSVWSTTARPLSRQCSIFEFSSNLSNQCIQIDYLAKIFLILLNVTRTKVGNPKTQSTYLYAHDSCSYMTDVLQPSSHLRIFAIDLPAKCLVFSISGKFQSQIDL